MSTKSKFIAKGSDGCITKPAVACTSNQHTQIPKDQEIVGKLYYSTPRFKHEMIIYKLIRHLDKTMQWSIPVFGSCQVMTSEIPDQCWDRNKFNQTPKTMQALMQYGGVSLDDYVRDKAGQSRPPLTKETFLRIMKTIGTGISMLQKYGYVHMDVKPANILVKVNKPYLIDFGMVTTLDNVYNINEHENLMKSMYVWYPPEFFLYYTLNLKKMRKLNIDDDNVIDSLTEYCMTTYDNKCYGLSKSDSSYAHNLASFKTFIKYAAKLPLPDLHRVMLESCAVKFDVYSLGAVCKNLYNRYHTSWPSHFQKTILKILDSMIDCDPLKRMNISKVLFHLKRVS